MKTYHPKSPCCQAPIRNYGGRRRQCKKCGKTWRIRPRKRGRRPKRIDFQALGKTFIHHETITLRARTQNRLSKEGVSYHFRNALRRTVQGPQIHPSGTGPTVLLVDGLWFRFHHYPWVLYLMALKPSESNTAWLAEPLLLPGKESAAKWRQAIRSLPPESLSTVRALVSDGFRGAKRLAAQYRWIHQRCHFHLLAQLQNRLGRRKRSWEDKPLRQAIYTAISQSLTATAPSHLSKLLAGLSHAIQDPGCPKRYRMLGRDYLRNVTAFRAYLHHPELHLPATTSAIESLFKSIRRFTRPLKSPVALSLWVRSFVRICPRFTCNGKNINQIS
jgi:hypothetical protein